MKFIRFGLGLILIACSHSPQAPLLEDEKPHVAVTLTHVTAGIIEDNINVSATTVYLNKQSVLAPLASYVVQKKVQPGTLVQPGQLLYVLESKEHHALKEKQEGSKVGRIEVKAFDSGIVTTAFQQMGGFVPEGTLLCTIADLNSLVFELNVPYEQMRYVKSTKLCTLIFPDGSKWSATITTPLATMNTALQVQQVIAKAKVPFLAEGMQVRALISKDPEAKEAQLLPKDAVQCDETMTHYWVMKLVNDSMAVKIPVVVGKSNGQMMTLVSPTFDTSDYLIRIGSYALEDSTLVTVTN